MADQLTAIAPTPCARPGRMRLMMSAAMSSALIGLGCQQPLPPQPSAPPRPTNPVAASATQATAAATPSPFLLVPSAAPTGAAVATPSITVVAEPSPTPLPGATVDSDLDPNDDAEVTRSLEESDIQAYLPTDLIHDGGVILYRALALGDRLDRPALSEGTNGLGSGNGPVATLLNCLGTVGMIGPKVPPATWRRLPQVSSGAQVVIRKAACAAGQDCPAAERRSFVVVKYLSQGTLTFKPDSASATISKSFVDLFKRGLLLKRRDGRWKLAEITPITLESQVGHSGLEIKQVSLYNSSNEKPILQVSNLEPRIALDNQPIYYPGETARVEVEVENRRLGELFVFTHLVGDSDRSKQRLMDDGTNGDRKADDGIYTGNFFVPATPGLRHFAIDILDTKAFSNCGPYRSNGIGLSFTVKAKP